MARYLVVAHETVTSPLLLNAVRGVREKNADAEFVLLVPATPVRNLLFRKGDEHDAEATARKRGERARALFTKRGVPLSDVHVGTADPAEAIDQEVAAHPGYAGFIISTLPAEKSRWLRMDLPRTVRAKHRLPVHVRRVSGHMFFTPHRWVRVPTRPDAWRCGDRLGFGRRAAVGKQQVAGSEPDSRSPTGAVTLPVCVVGPLGRR
jgi:hypothetical protein